jgi:hypothetical protein
MSKSGDRDLYEALKSIEKRLKSIQGTLKSFESRIGALEGAVEQRVQVSGENPLIFSKVLMGTVEAISEYETEHQRGVVAKDLARLRGVEQPTIYDHLSKLEEANLIFWQRGSELGLKPFNAKFYSVSNRSEHLEDLPVLMSLPDDVTPIAQAILKGGKAGVSRKQLLGMMRSLAENGEEPWSKISAGKIESHLDDALKLLLRRVLIRYERKLEDDYFYPRTD